MAKDERLFIVGIGPVIERLQSTKAAIKLWVSEERAEKASPSFQRVLQEAKTRGLEIETLPRREFDRRLPNQNHQGVVLIAPPFEYADIEDVLAKDAGERDLLVALDSVTDPHNLGAVARSAYLLGASALIIPSDRAASVTPVVIKASAGATENLPICQVTNLARTLADLKAYDYWNAAIAASEQSTPLVDADAKGPICLVMGSEGEGLRKNVQKQCDFTWHIPMLRDGVGSFNVSVAASIALYEVARQRQLAKR